ncbi:MAG: Zn-ribbon containing protein [Halanaeroarchaeum sp.]
MPHQCTACGQTFDDGSKEMLSGCPECGGNTFQYIPSDAVTDDPGPTDAPESSPDETPTPADQDDGGVTEAVGKAATTVRDYVARRRDEDSPTVESPPDDGAPAAESPSGADETATTDPASTEPTDAETVPSERTEAEDAAQASARGEMVDSGDLPSAGSAPAGTGGPTEPPGEGRVLEEPDVESDVDRPDLEELRAELNEQFESIRIVAPGQYELNLMELYDRQEHIIALQEDGRYVIEVPDTWRDQE